RLGGPQVRRLSNQFFYEELLIGQDTDDGAKVAGAVLQEPWAPLVSEDFHAAMVRSTTKLGPDHWARGSKMSALAPPAGFEPALTAPEAVGPQWRLLGKPRQLCCLVRIWSTRRMTAMLIFARGTIG